MKDLDREVARVLGDACIIGDSYLSTEDGEVVFVTPLSGSEERYSEFSPSTNWSQCGPLIEKYWIGIEGGSAWLWKGDKCIGRTGETPLIAACRAIIAMEGE